MLESTGNTNDAARARFLRISNTLLNLIQQEAQWSDEWFELCDRKSEFAEFLPLWEKELPTIKGVIWGSLGIEKGFVWDVHCKTARVFVENASVIFSSAPIGSVSLGRGRQTIGELAHVKEMFRVTRLIFEECELGHRAALALAGSAHLANITHLHLSSNRLGDSGARVIAESPHLLNLQNLDLSNNEIGDEGVVSLASSPIVSRLESLGLAGSTMGSIGADALAESKHLSRITGLTLWDCNKLKAKNKSKLKARFGDAVSFDD